MIICKKRCVAYAADVVGAFLAVLGSLWDLGGLGGLLGTSWGSLGASWGPLGGPWGSLGTSGGLLEAFWGRLGHSCGDSMCCARTAVGTTKVGSHDGFPAVIHAKNAKNASKSCFRKVMQRHKAKT